MQDLTLEEIRQVVEEVNEQVHQERLRKLSSSPGSSSIVHFCLFSVHLECSVTHYP